MAGLADLPAEDGVFIYSTLIVINNNWTFFFTGYYIRFHLSQ